MTADAGEAVRADLSGAGDDQTVGTE